MIFVSDENSNSVSPVEYICGISALFFLIFVYYKAFQKNCPNCVANLLSVCRKKAPERSLGPVFSNGATGSIHRYKRFPKQKPRFEADKGLRCDYRAIEKIEEGEFVQSKITRVRSNSF